MSMRRVTAAALAATLGLALAGCTGEPRLSKQEYEERLGDVTMEFAAALQNLFSAPEVRQPGSLARSAGIIRRGAATVRQVAGQLAELNPPEDAQAAHERLVEGFRRLADEVDGFARDAEESDVDGVERFLDQMAGQELAGATLITEALQELARLGYDVGG